MGFFVFVRFLLISHRVLRNHEASSLSSGQLSALFFKVIPTTIRKYFPVVSYYMIK